MCWAEDARELSAPPQAVFPGSSRSLRDFRWITPHERWDREGTSQERSKAPALETSINFDSDPGHAGQHANHQAFRSNRLDSTRY